MTLVLASASPRRADLLRAAGYVFAVDAADVDERRLAGESALGYVERVARRKAAAVAARHPEAVVLAADTTVVVGPIDRPSEADGGDVLGKPGDAGEASRMLRHLSGRAHEVLTGVAIASEGRVEAFVDVTRVWFDTLTDDDIEWYVSSGEPVDKAGAYAIQGLASRFIVRIEGSYANVVGLPVARVHQRLRHLAVTR